MEIIIIAVAVLVIGIGIVLAVFAHPQTEVNALRYLVSRPLNYMS